VSREAEPMRTMTPEEWCANAPDGAHWRLWGKARPELGTAIPGHPLLYHMVDVAVTAESLLKCFVPRAFRQRLQIPVALDEEEFLRFVAWIVALHDFGKATPAFQQKADLGILAKQAGLAFDVRRADFDHGRIGLDLLSEAVSERLGEMAVPMARAVVAHHGVFPSDADLQPGDRQKGEGGWREAQRLILEEISKAFPWASAPAAAVQGDKTWFVLLAGLTCVADWVGSMVSFFPYQAPSQSLAEYAEASRARAMRALHDIGMVQGSSSGRLSFHDLFPDLTPWPLHELADRVASEMREPTLVVVEAPMGEGKTEAALTLVEAARNACGCTGLFIGLPTQSTANQMFSRVEQHLRRSRPQETTQILLAHGAASLVDDFRKLVHAVYDPDQGGDVRASNWFLSSKRALLASHAVGTIDQALLGVLRVRHGFVRLTGLAGKVVVLDEVHAFDTYTSTLLDRLVEWMSAMGCTVVLLSATLPSNRRQQLLESWRRGRGAAGKSIVSASSYPRLTICKGDDTETRTFSPRSAGIEIVIERADDELASLVPSLLVEIAAGGCVGWICNTVARAQAVAQAVRAAAPDLTILLVHARMLPEERRRRERELLAWLGRSGQRPERCVVIGTQVLEQSLDVDFDWLRTDVAPVDLLLQRAGRLHRHHRPARPARHRAPRLSVVMPTGSWHQADLRKIARVYVDYSETLMRRTMRLLEGRACVRLPDEIEALVEAVYVLPDPPEFSSAMARCLANHRESVAKREVAARKHLLPSPSNPDDFLADLQPDVRDDDDPSLHESLRAVTRLGPPSVDAVCLHVRDNALFLDEECTMFMDLETEPSRGMVDQLVRRTIGITRPDVVAALLTQPTPKGWQKQPLLRFRRVVRFRDGVAEVGRSQLRLDAELGLVIDRREL
jgi:CRISPR-associated endonuclease/helicase Cas3